MLPVVARSLVAGGACYAFTEGVRYLCTRPNLDGRVADLFDRIRMTFADIRDDVAHDLGPILWGLSSQIAFENAWISTFVLCLLYMSEVFVFTGTLLQVAVIYCAANAITMPIWLLRVAIAELLPEFALWIAECVAPRNYPVPVPVHYVSQPQAAQERNDQVANSTPYSLTRCNISDLPDIPEELHEDECLSNYICPITFAPIRDPVRDPNGRTVYERRAIYSWLREKLISPVTRAQLLRSDLQELPHLKKFIEDRLKMHGERLKEIAEKGGLKEALKEMLHAPINEELAKRAADELRRVSG